MRPIPVNSNAPKARKVAQPARVSEVAALPRHRAKVAKRVRFNRVVRVWLFATTGRPDSRRASNRTNLAIQVERFRFAQRAKVDRIDAVLQIGISRNPYQ